LVVAPQTKKLPARSQKSPLRALSRRTRSAFGRRFRRRAVREHSDVGRPIADQQRHQRQEQRDHRGDEQRHRAPAVLLDDVRLEGEKDHLAGGRARGEHAHHRAAARDEPAVHHRGAEHHRGGPRAEAHQDPPSEHELPAGAHLRGERDARADQRQRGEHRPADAEALHESGSEWTHQAVEDEVDRDGRGEQRAAPAELALERNDQDRRGRAHGRGAEEHHEDGAGDDERGMDPCFHDASSRLAEKRAR
jgi:hypothetical protein